MFRRLSEPLPLSEASLLLLRPALNTPVLNVGYLPVGPARAAVVAFAEEYGGIGIALGVRSSESGQLVVLRNQESIDFDAPLAEALEPLLDAAERMGFLFDEDMLQLEPGPNGRSAAMVHWAVLMGGMESLLPPARTRADSRSVSEDRGEGSAPLSPSLAVEESQYAELILDDVAPLELPAMASGPDAAIDETFEEEPEADLASNLAPHLAPDLDEDLEEDLEEDLDETLDDVLDEALADGFEDELDEGDVDWDLAAPLPSELDLTEPTAPILALRQASPPGPTAPIATARRAAPLKSTPPPAETPVLAAPVAAAAPPEVPAPAPDVVALPRVVLSKFRQQEGTATGQVSNASKAELGTDGAAELARIPIVRVRRETEKKVPFLARLLSSF